MIDHFQARIDALREELRWLKRHATQYPSDWAFSQIAELEGMLAAQYEETAWVETNKLIKRLQVTD